MPLLFGWFAMLVTAQVDVRGTSTCPTPQMVAERATPLVPAGDSLPAGLFAEVTNVANGAGPSASWAREEIEVQLRSSESPAPLASRRLPRTGSCGALGEAAAVVVASWTVRYETPELTPALDAAGPPTVHAAVPAARSPVDGSSSLATWSVGVGGGLASGTRGGIAPVVGPELTTYLGTGRWFVRLSIGAMGQRRLAIDAGSATWWRAFAAPALGARWGDRYFFEASVGPAIGPVMVRGQGFTSNDSSWSMEAGLSSALRMGVGLGPGSRFAAALSVSGIGWVRPHQLSVAQSPSGATVPPGDLLVGVAVDYKLGR